MIIVNVIGGLGNQMFQYAAGRALAARHREELLLDTRLFATYRLHNGFELDRLFPIKARIASDADIKDLIGWRASRAARRLLADKRLTLLAGKNYFREKGISFNQEFLTLPKDCYLLGHWQSARYFEGYERLTKESFRFKEMPTKTTKAIANQIRNEPASVSLHVRRGDYVTNPRANEVHGVCSISFYSRAMKHIEQRACGIVYYVFSDDIDWVRRNLKINREHHFVSHNSCDDSYNDMLLMSICRHHIIANSSFSWWGAWLNQWEEKIVIAPKRWFANGADSSTHVPDKWVRL